MDRPASNQGPEASWPWTWPLGGDVTQRIGTWWIKSLSDQTGFININNVRAGDPQLERRIIEDVASYGRQLGRMMEALDVVIGHLRLGEGKDLTADASLPNKIVDAMLGSRGARIGPDERLNFHEYLKQLDSSESFFSDLHGGEAAE